MADTAAPAAPATPAAAPSAPAGGGEPKGGAPKPGETPAGGVKPDGSSPKPGETPAAAAARKKKYQVEGREVEVDLSDEAALDRLIQKGLGADKRFKETAAQRQQAEALITMLRKNPMAVLEQVAKMTGQDPRKVVEDYLWENHVKLEQLTPEQREAELNKRKLADLETKEKERLSQEQAAQFEKAKQHYRATFERDIMGALETGGLPKTAWTVQRMAHYMAQALKAKVKVSAGDVVSLVREDFEGGFREMFGAANAEVLAKIVGDDGLKKLREWEMAKLKAQGMQPASGERPPAAPPAIPAGTGERNLSRDEWRERLRQRTG